MNKRVKIAIVSGTRAEYGLLRKLIRRIHADESLELQLIVTGAHLASEFGSTVKEIEEDGVPIARRLEMLLASDTTVGMGKSAALAVLGLVDVFDQLKPDFLLLLGDRYETFAAAQAAMYLNCPMGHMHGGEKTEGAIDEAIRHSITKMAHLHFTASEEYRRRVIQLGENPDHVLNVGAMALDGVADLNLLERNELGRQLGFPLAEKNFIVTYHPVTLDPVSSEKEIVAMLEALEQFPEANVYFTMSNADSGGKKLWQQVKMFTEKFSSRSRAFSSLGQLKYLSLLKQADLVLGNSSSGLIEAPTFRIPTVNIGDRQRGRMAAKSVLHVEQANPDLVVNAIRKALSPEFRTYYQSETPPYGNGNASEKIVSILKSTKFNSLLKKKFYDL
jgi:GDP/UDP-N,N'-diacetylbacillosamine 2-epimerase (hydrolysing)